VEPGSAMSRYCYFTGRLSVCPSAIDVGVALAISTIILLVGGAYSPGAVLCHGYDLRTDVCLAGWLAGSSEP